MSDHGLPAPYSRRGGEALNLGHSRPLGQQVRVGCPEKAVFGTGTIHGRPSTSGWHVHVWPKAAVGQSLQGRGVSDQHRVSSVTAPLPAISMQAFNDGRQPAAVLGLGLVPRKGQAG